MAYAAVISLKHNIKHLAKSINRNKYEDEVLDELYSVGSMLKELDDRSNRGIDRSVINVLDAKIREAVWKLEDVLDSHRVDDDEEEIDSFLNTVKNLSEEYNRVLQNPLPAEEDDVDATVPPKNKSTTVGLSNLSDEIISELLRETFCYRTVSLVGMAGIGKTHLATLIYHHPLILQHFDLRLWVSVGPRDQITKDIIVDIVAQIEGKPVDLFKDKSEETLRDLVLNSLRGRRYLVVLDGIWSTQVLNDLAGLLLRYKNGSRFLLTTRLQEVAEYYNWSPKIHKMPFLNIEESWDLLWQNVFTDEESFPSELEKSGRKIAEMCEGLPLLILAVADILRGVDNAEEDWKMVAEKKTTTFTDAYDQIYEVLLSSYDYLPQHLKACFLYMGVFPQSCEIPLSKLTNLWILENFVEPSWPLSFEASAMICMESVVSYNLAIVCEWSFERVRIKSVRLHCAYWYLCVEEARKNKFFHVLNKLTDVCIEDIESYRRLSIQNNILFGIQEAYDSMAAATSSTARSLLCTGEDHQYPVRLCFNMMLMKVLDALAIRFYEFPEEVLKLLQLRYLSLTHNGELPGSISNLQQLQSLVLRRHHNIKLLVQRDSSCLPQQIWDMRELRHLRIMGSNLPNPSNGAELPNLKTLYVNADSCTEAVFRSTTELEKLVVKIELEPDTDAEALRCLQQISLLRRLESLKCVVVNPRIVAAAPRHYLSNLSSYLKKLSLNGLGYPWRYIRAIASLENLKILKLRCSAFRGPTWAIMSDEFKNLEYLLLEDLDLVHWCFPESKYHCETLPCLRYLVVRHCYKLKMIPQEIGRLPLYSHYTDVSPLKLIEVDECSPSVVASAQKIRERIDFPNLVINSSALDLIEVEDCIDENEAKLERMVEANSSLVLRTSFDI